MTVYELIRALAQGIIDGKWSGESPVASITGDNEITWNVQLDDVPTIFGVKEPEDNNMVEL